MKNNFFGVSFSRGQQIYYGKWLGQLGNLSITSGSNDRRGKQAFMTYFVLTSFFFHIYSSMPTVYHFLILFHYFSTPGGVNEFMALYQVGQVIHPLLHREATQWKLGQSYSQAFVTSFFVSTLLLTMFTLFVSVTMYI